MILHSSRQCLVSLTLAGGLRKGHGVTQVVGQSKVVHAIYKAVVGEHQAQRVTFTEGGHQVRGNSCSSTGTAISQYC